MTAQQSILVAVDQSTTFDELRPVVDLARGTQWRVDLIHAAPPEGAYVGSDDLGGLLDPDARPVQLAIDEGRLAALVDRFAANGVVAEPYLEEGATVEVILNQAEQLESTMIVLIGRTKKVADRVIHGSTVSGILRMVERPVVVLPSANAGAASGGFRSSLNNLSDALEQFETDHPALTKAVNDVSYYLSGMGI